MPHGGKNSLIDLGSGAVICVNKWSANQTGKPNRQVCSATRGGSDRSAGNNDWSGSFEANGHTAPCVPGQLIADAIFVSGGTPGSQHGCTGDIRIDSIDISCPVEAGGSIMYTVNFSAAAGALVESDSLNVAAPTGLPVTYPAKGCKVEIGTVAGSPVFTELLDIRDWKLTLKADNVSYNSSTTGGNTAREEGNFDFTATITYYVNDAADAPNLNDVGQWRLYVGASTYYDLKWAIVSAVGPFESDRSTGAIVSSGVTIEQKGFASPGGTPTGGYVKNPATTAIWSGT